VSLKIKKKTPNVPGFTRHKNSIFLTIHMNILTFPQLEKKTSTGRQEGIGGEEVAVTRYRRKCRRKDRSDRKTRRRKQLLDDLKEARGY
jgi:hypothetical protein